MAIEKSLDNILNSRSKIAIIRLFISKTADFRATGREVAKLIKVSPPATHASLKELYTEGVLKLDIIGKQHIYSMDDGNRVVERILKPMFKKELSVKSEIKNFLLRHARKSGMENKIVSVILYGSLQRGKTNAGSDVDIAVIIKNKNDRKEIEDKFLNEISTDFNRYFKTHLDVYIKTQDEFRMRLGRNLPPVSTLAKSYSVLWGKELSDI